ncbi:MAG: hypothetical protein JWR80_8034 [Bradyrhizobium sp.]|nr:hypothetical protein [Bradyrhizobium sp.]
MMLFGKPAFVLGGGGAQFGNPAFRSGDRAGLSAGTGGGASGPYPPPFGYRWEYITENGIGATESGQPVVELVRIT